jgi:hypothetical protein
MVRLVGILACAVATTGVSTSAHAGYLTLGVGEGATLRGDFSRDHEQARDSASGRVGVGQRLGRLALEAALSGSDVGATRAVSLSLDLKIYQGLGGGLAVYGRGGIGRSWLDQPFADAGFEGRNQQLGVGLELAFDAPIGHLGVYIDVSRQRLDLTGAAQARVVGELDALQLGVSVGL